MDEINGNFSVNQVKLNNSQKQISEQAQIINEEEKEPKLKDFSDPKAEALGRSMLIKDADNINNDLKALIKKPQIADNSDELFEKSYKAALASGVEHPYEAASTFSTGSV